eukprot:CAMPEP_0113578976 /NCGR_PEP_ID=MMETSP0015_2-20120614/29807_1 /TAXON_ID=2838 /ORGANISM="Odontella" /LENGTH=139 /DNA_ID=CAMNT_0000482895 /DNA_START=169 /DNA_END=586 /DNA_ORIENTATION=- /assembly_acc=CAM_ASM_000160
MKDACPIRNIEGKVKNVTDFGAFIDFGGENDGLLHVSKAGPSGLKNFVVGSIIGIDILGVCTDSGRVSLSLSGLGHNALPAIASTERKRKLQPKKREKGGDGKSPNDKENSISCARCHSNVGGKRHSNFEFEHNLKLSI